MQRSFITGTDGTQAYTTRGAMKMHSTRSYLCIGDGARFEYVRPHWSAKACNPRDQQNVLGASCSWAVLLRCHLSENNTWVAPGDRD